MTSAKERAVEAGARAASPHAFNDAFWLSRKAPDHHQRHARENARNHAKAVLRAAFPILAEELVKEVEGLAGLSDLETRERLLDVVTELRARIQQMAEAL